jgi:hypothetical protein
MRPFKGQTDDKRGDQMSSQSNNPPGETADEWWQRNEPTWRKTPAYYENLRSKAERFGKEWVRSHKSSVDGYCAMPSISTPRRRGSTSTTLLTAIEPGD